MASLVKLREAGGQSRELDQSRKSDLLFFIERG